MGKKFDEIYESVVSRGVVGGYLPGDVVKFVSGYKKHALYKAMPLQMQKEIDDLTTCGLHIRVTQVGDKISNTGSGNQHKGADSVVLTIGADQGGGRYYSKFVVSPEMLEIVDFGPNLPPIPDAMVHKFEVDFKPREYKADLENTTRLTDKGNGKNTPTNLKLAGESNNLRDDMANMAMLYEDATA